MGKAFVTIGALIDEGADRLGAPDGRVEAEYLLGAVIAKGRAFLRAFPERAVGQDEAAVYRELLDRRWAGEPMAYLTGVREFWSLALNVTPAVLVPRPETEVLIELALELAADRSNQGLRVADLGTGSGAIALAIASERPAWHVAGTDRSREALAVARGNAVSLRLDRVTFLLGSWCEALAGTDFSTCDLLVCNPPYVAHLDPCLDGPDLRFEPRAALTAGADALAAFRAVAQCARAHLAPQGWLVFEHGHTQAAQVAAVLEAHGFTGIIHRRDLAGHARVCAGQWHARTPEP